MNDDEIRERIRKNLIKLRKEKGLTQADVGKIIGKSESTVSSWEKGLSLPDHQTLYKLAKYYDISADYIFSLDISGASYFSPEEQDIILAYRKLSSDQKDMIASAMGVKRQDTGSKSSEVG